MCKISFSIIAVCMLLLQSLFVTEIDLQLDQAHAVHSPDYQIFPAFYPGWDSDDSSLCIGASHALHPSVLHFPDGLWGYRIWMAYTPYCVSEADENPHIAVSNDGLNWQEFESQGDTLTNPVVEISDVNATHLSDPDLVYGPAGWLWLIFRASWEQAGLDRHALYAMATDNGLDWTDPVEILSDNLLGQSQISAFVSPAVVVTEDNNCFMFVVEPRAAGTTFLDTSRVIRYVSASIGGPWEFADTCLFPASNDSMKIWHLEVLPRENAELIALVTESPNDRMNFGDSAELYLAGSDDGGNSWVTNGEPLLTWVSDTTRWYGQTVYRSSGYWLDNEPSGILALYYSCLSKPANQGGCGTGWQTGLTHVFFDTSTTPIVAGISINELISPQHVVNHQPTIGWLYLDPTGERPQVLAELEVGTDSDWTDAEMWNPALIETSDANVTYEGSDLEDGETYYLRLRVNNNVVWSDWYETSFRMNTAPTIPIPLQPIDNAFTSSTPTLWIENSTDVEGDALTYDFFCVVDTIYGESSPMAGFNIAEGIDSTGWPLTKSLHENWGYFWRARSFDGYEYSNWTNLFESNFYMNEVSELPSVPQAQFPPDTGGMPVYDMLTLFNWSLAVDPDPLDSVLYRLEISTDSEFSVMYVVDSIGMPPWALTDSLYFGTHYWWRVIAFDIDSLSTPSCNIPDFWTWTLGDLDLSHNVNITDLTQMVDFLFQGGLPLYPAFIGDLDSDCNVNVADLTYLVAFLFIGGPAPGIGCE